MMLRMSGISLLPEWKIMLERFIADRKDYTSI